ncbi:PP0621 family protein [uncultured Pseudomonas sp.]|uniref:PP0621 family protein n=1 Tax=uncultured Pseudomonas sp. TaxID=114707 RepID=UPI0025F9317F|nr:PP0621 family protein [uncultured Pseudomonas sp.]
MGLLRLLLWLVLLGALFWMVRRWWRGKTQPQATKARPLPPNPMVRCAHCGVHVPQERALPDGDHQRWYCSAEHRRLQHEPRN